MRMPFLRAVAQTFTASYRWIILAGVWVDNTFPCTEIYRHIHTGTHTQVHTHKHKHKHIHTSTNTHLHTTMTAGRRASARARHDRNERNTPTVKIQELHRHCIYNPWKFHKNPSEDEKLATFPFGNAWNGPCNMFPEIVTKPPCAGSKTRPLSGPQFHNIAEVTGCYCVRQIHASCWILNNC
jgi:hypothetical protein